MSDETTATNALASIGIPLKTASSMGVFCCLVATPGTMYHSEVFFIGGWWLAVF
jgi:hypothetical protein